jgi:hypothetical protein
MDELCFLSDEEIAGICEPLKQHAARVKFLRGLGMKVGTKPNGKPLVARSEWERVMGDGKGAPWQERPCVKPPRVKTLAERKAERGNEQR